MGAKASMLILLAACVALGLARCEGLFHAPGRRDVAQIRFWNGFTGPDGRTMLRMVRRFNEANPDVYVTMQRMDWNTYYNKLMVAGIGGRGPELFVIHASTLARMHRAGFIAPATNLFGDGPGLLPRDDFDPRVLEQTLYDGELIGVPLDIHPQGFYGNARMLREAGLVNPDGTIRPPQTKEEFFDAIRRTTKDADGDGRIDVWGYAYTHWRLNFMTLMPQFGGRFFDEEGRCVLDDPANVAALEFLASFRRQGLAPDPENNAGWIGFRQHRVAMVFDGIYMLGDLKRLDDLEYVAAPIPRLGDRPGSQADSHVLCIRQGIDERRREAAERFVRFLSDNSLEWAHAGQVPARRSVRATEAFRELAAPYQFSRQVPYIMFPPRTPILFELLLEVDLAVEKVIRGRAEPAEALKVARQNVQRFMDREARQRGPGRGREDGP